MSSSFTLMFCVATQITIAIKTSDILIIYSDVTSNLPAMKVRVHTLRRMVEIARVEIHPGVRKSKLETYPPNYFQRRLKRLLHLKEKREKAANMNANLQT
ncbi:unnamed protein product [Chilo suppressalis]|uniref:60S ribosomal protein L35 n=1 Tax=Chilo suppressalis TaxID=168631 RepID=A0ABN8EBR1_CHISP|nr:unnamed protein product [Chilo suppressalis]